MAQRELKDDEHAVRFCKPIWLIKDTETGKIIGLNPDAFRLRDENKPPEIFISGQWLEYFPGALLQKLTAARDALKSRGRGVSKSSAFALVNRQTAVECGNRFDAKIRIVHAPKSAALDYAKMHGTKNDNGALLQALVTTATVDIVATDTIP